MIPLDIGGHQAKKGRMRKRDEEPPPPPSSYSQAVIGGPLATDAAKPVVWPEDQPVDIEEGDITPVIGEQGGIITLSSQLRSRLDKQWERAVVVKVLSCRGRMLQAKPDSRGGLALGGSRYAVLDQVTTGLEPGESSGASTQVRLEGLGQRVQVEV
ncbi:hypothetical protein K2173_020729 [Erythroxylum novogranatense]|uniref:Uncharacterized protein n=1 Tax=Erythroxylum novogranatense TaxID=1862640 RepID=A0AAV8TPF6_9ROSI|nr:hypothetical protein K2173_020729 [Erythroxylum novogranatense]